MKPEAVESLKQRGFPNAEEYHRTALYCRDGYGNVGIGYEFIVNDHAIGYLQEIDIDVDSVDSNGVSLLTLKRTILSDNYFEFKNVVDWQTGEEVNIYIKIRRPKPEHQTPVMYEGRMIPRNQVALTSHFEIYRNDEIIGHIKRLHCELKTSSDNTPLIEIWRTKKDGDEWVECKEKYTGYNVPLNHFRMHTLGMKDVVMDEQKSL